VHDWYQSRFTEITLNHPNTTRRNNDTKGQHFQHDTVHDWYQSRFAEITLNHPNTTRQNNDTMIHCMIGIKVGLPKSH